MQIGLAPLSDRRGKSLLNITSPVIRHFPHRFNFVARRCMITKVMRRTMAVASIAKIVNIVFKIICGLSKYEFPGEVKLSRPGMAECWRNRSSFTESNWNRQL